MPTTKTAAFAAAALAAAAVLFSAACASSNPSNSGAPPPGSKTPTNESTAAVRSAAEPCVASKSWIDQPGQPQFGTDPQSNCQFHQYAWQSFLYLTSPALNGGLQFEQFPSMNDVFHRAMQTDMAVMTDKRTKRVRRFLPRTIKSVEPFDDDHQAGGVHGVLVSQSNQITYYEQLMDPTGASFIQACDLAIYACQSAPAAATLRFPKGSIEIKASWLPMFKSDPNAAQFYKIDAKDFQVIGPDGKPVHPDFMALVGFHLVFATAGHPEMIWATFEHRANAPDGPCVEGMATTPPAPFRSWTFNNAANTSCKGINTFQDAKPIPIAQAVRLAAFGGGTPANTSNIEQLNQSVQQLLPQQSIWRNYFLVGALWTKNGVLPASSGNEAGSLQLANATMETFEQDQNCFACHNTASASSKYLVSHALPFKGKPVPACPYSTTLPAACLATQK